MIEKNILQISIGLNHKHPDVQEITKKMLDINKSHTYILIDSEKKMDDWVTNKYLNSTDKFLHTAGEAYFEAPKMVGGGKLKNVSLVTKIDFFRALFLYMEGGFYLDLDGYFHADIDEFTAGTDMYLTFYSINIVTALFFCKKKHPILKFVIQKMTENVRNKVGGLLALCGPHAMCRGVIDGHNFYQNTNLEYPSNKSTSTIDSLRGKTFTAEGFKYKFSKDPAFGSATDKDRLFNVKMKNWRVLYEGTSQTHWGRELGLKH